MPASYPGAVKTFTSKANGDQIQASHVTDLQDEVTALEDGLLNGTAPINSSRITAPAAQVTNCTVTNLTVTNFAFPANSTLTNLNVTGGSTFSGANFSSNVNIVGDSSIAGDLFVVKRPPSARVSQSATVQFANNTETCLNFNTQTSVYPTSMHSTTTNSSRLTAPSSGMYLVSGHVLWNTFSSAGMRQVVIYKNDATIIAADTRPAGVANALWHSIATVYPLNSGDWVTLRVVQDSGSTGSIIATSEGGQQFTLTKVR